MKTVSSANGSGKLTAQELKNMLASIPTTAVVSVKTETDPRDGTSSWSFTAEWDSSAAGFSLSGVHHRGDGKRSGGSGDGIGDSVRRGNDEAFGPYGVGAAFPGDH